MLNNLLSNAIKFTNEGEISLSIKELENQRIEIRIKDSGIGINEKKQRHMYDAFEQGEHYLSKKYGGTGLGLAITKKIIDLLDGEIHIDSEIGKGTQVTIILPFKEVKLKEEIESQDETDLFCRNRKN